jgi:hypothetical protein
LSVLSALHCMEFRETIRQQLQYGEATPLVMSSSIAAGSQQQQQRRKHPSTVQRPTGSRLGTVFWSGSSSERQSLGFSAWNLPTFA